MNNIKTMVLMAGLLGLFLLAGQLLGGSQGLVLALVLGSAFNFIMYFFSDKIVLRMYGAQIVSEEQARAAAELVAMDRRHGSCDAWGMTASHDAFEHRHDLIDRGDAMCRIGCRVRRAGPRCP